MTPIMNTPLNPVTNATGARNAYTIQERLGRNLLHARSQKEPARPAVFDYPEIHGKLFRHVKPFPAPIYSAETIAEITGNAL